MINMTPHPGFKAVASGIASKGGYSMKTASAILAASTRRAGAKAKRANPALSRVKGADYSNPAND